MTDAWFKHNLQELCDSAAYSYSRGLHLTALALFYMAMDMVTAYEASERQGATRRDIFIAWVHRYLSPSLPPNVNAADLWDGRRQVLCTRRQFGEVGADDALGRKDPLAFCGTRAEVPDLQTALCRAGVPTERVVAVDTVIEAFEMGITRYIDVLEAEPDRLEDCADQANSLLNTVNFWRPLSVREPTAQATRIHFVNLVGVYVGYPRSFTNAKPRQATERTGHA